MDGPAVLSIVEAIHDDKRIDKEIVFEGIRQAILSAARKHFGEERELVASIDRESGEPFVSVDGTVLEPSEIGDLIGRIGAQTAKQVMIQKIREAERDTLYDEYADLQSQIMTGTITRLEHGTATVSLGKIDALLPRSEQIPGEGHRLNERIRAVVLEVSKAGSRLKIILSRTHADFVRRLFELEIPEVNDHVIEVRSIAREAGYRSKVAVSCYDSKIDSVGACVGVRGTRIKNIIDELGGERIDIVRWNDSLQVLVPNALQPAEVEDVILCPEVGKVIVLVRDDQLSLAIGKKGQNVRLASKLVGWDIDVMTQDRLDEQIDQSVESFTQIPEMTEELVEKLIEEGFFTFDDLSVIEPDLLEQLSGLSEEDCDKIIDFADRESLRIEQEEIEAARLKREEMRNPSPPVEQEPADSPEKATDEPATNSEETQAEADSEPEAAVSDSTPEDSVTEEDDTDNAAAEEEVIEDPVAEEELVEEPVGELDDETKQKTVPPAEASLGDE